jgi:undecaprenyl pyrophosphate phosphatase UppP
MILFAVVVSLVFGLVARDTSRERFFYGLKVFAEFMVIGLALAWLLYFLPL